MPVTDSVVAEMLASMGAARPITSRKMFGGVGLYSDGVFFGVIDDDHLYFKVDDVVQPEYDRVNAAQWVIEGDPPQVMPYREVPDSAFTNAEEMGSWIDQAVAVALRKKSKPKGKGPGRQPEPRNK